jgi:hypothetical protein
LRVSDHGGMLSCRKANDFSMSAMLVELCRRRITESGGETRGWGRNGSGPSGGLCVRSTPRATTMDRGRSERPVVRSSVDTMDRVESSNAGRGVSSAGDYFKRGGWWAGVDQQAGLKQ